MRPLRFFGRMRLISWRHVLFWFAIKNLFCVMSIILTPIVQINSPSPQQTRKALFVNDWDMCVLPYFAAGSRGMHSGTSRRGLGCWRLPNRDKEVGWAAETSQAADEAVRPFEGPVHPGKVELSCHAITCFWWKAYLLMSTGIHVRCFSSRHFFHSFRFW